MVFIRDSSKEFIRFSIGMLLKFIFNLLAKSFASLFEWDELHLEGIETQYILLLPRAAVAIAETSAESMPPLSPIKAVLKPHF